MCKISLRPDAIRLLSSYRWPGNVRQLMGFTQALTAQVSQKVTPSRQRIELSAAELMPFMPVEEGEPLPVVFEGPSGGAPQGSAGPVGMDLQPIVKAIFDLNTRIDDLEARLDRRSLPAPSVSVREQEAEWQGPEFATPSGRVVESDAEEQPQQEPPTLSVKEQEAELIRKALVKHGGNRKLAAEELGMSERTLYRKLPPEYRKK
jgi:DNA-binding NtrC family response regulator